MKEKEGIVNIVYLIQVPCLDLNKAEKQLSKVIEAKYDQEHPFKSLRFKHEGLYFELWGSGKLYGKGLKSWADILRFKILWHKLYKRHLISCKIQPHPLNTPVNSRDKIRF